MCPKIRRRIGTFCAVPFFLVLIWAPKSWGAADGGIPRLEKKGSATQLIVNGKPFVMLAGELHNSSASSLDYMRGLPFGTSASSFRRVSAASFSFLSMWDKLTIMKINTVIASLSWELVEPEEGKYDFSLIDGLIKEARQHDLKLVFIWFGAWKNCYSTYPPAWVKKDLDRFVRVRNTRGDVQAILSPLCEATCAAESKAFAAVMRHVREADGKHTVLMMQVENEAGLLGEARDHSPLAEAAFAKPVPAPLLSYLKEHRESLIPELQKIWEAAGFRESGTWAEVFGQGDGADEVFMAWHIGGYIGRIAAAGKAAYPIPMYANAWLVQSEGQKPGRYPSGGPVSKMMDVWRAAAPAIDLLAPDIYLPDFKGVCASYTRSGNPLMIPEAGRGPDAPGRAFWAIAECNAICFAPFGIEGMDLDHPLARNYKLLADLMPLITKHQGTGRMVGLMETEKEEGRDVELGDYRAHIRFRSGEKKDGQKGYGLIIALAPDEFLLAGNYFSVSFSPKPGLPPRCEILSVWEGRYDKDGKWQPGRCLNGDETAANSRAQLPPNYGDKFANPDLPGILRVKVFSHR